MESRGHEEVAVCMDSERRIPESEEQSAVTEQLEMYRRNRTPKKKSEETQRQNRRLCAIIIILQCIVILILLALILNERSDYPQKTVLKEISAEENKG
jgi:hypothetical protein